MDVESPLKGWPPTSQLQGQPGFRIEARHLTARRANFTDYVCGFVNLGALILLGWLFFSQHLTGGQPFLIAFGIFLAFCFLTWGTRRIWGTALFGKMTIVQFEPARIMLMTHGAFRNYDAKLPHEFDFRIHDEAEKEQERAIEKYQRAQRQGNEFKDEKYFRNSFHIIFRYAGQRIDVADVYERKPAEALLVRLQLLDQLMSAARGDTTTPVYAESDQQYGERPDAG